MNETVNAFVNADKDTEIREIFYSSLNGCTDRIFFTYNVPGIRFDLFEAE